MPPKSTKKGTGTRKAKSGGGGGGGTTDEDEREERLQAVVLADSFETRFHPFTRERPRCLLPLANTPLLEYTCEFLAHAGVDDVYLYCGHHAEQVEEYLKQSKWMRDTAPFALEIIRSPARSVGDAMRDLHQKQLITGDFLCVYGDLVANVPLAAALAAHRARGERDKKAIMTMVLREAGPAAPSVGSARPCFVLEPESQRCVHYEQVRAGAGSGSARLEIPEEVLREHAALDVRADLVDCGIDLCTPEVLAQWSDNFDWQLPRRGFLYGVLKDYETMQLSIHAHVLPASPASASAGAGGGGGGYAARVRSPRAYAAVSRAVLARRTYPLCPDANLGPDQGFRLLRGPVYREDGVALARSGQAARRVVLGRGTSVGEGSVIADSVVGRRCVIGRRVRIEGAFVWDDVRIGDDTVIEGAIVGNEASIGKRCRIRAGALLSYGVRIGDGGVVGENVRLTRLKRKRADAPEEEEEEEEEGWAPADAKTLGENGLGFAMELDEEEEDADEAFLSDLSALQLTPSSDSISTLNSDDDDDDDDGYEPRHAPRSESFASINSDESGSARHHAAAAAAAADFHHEAVSSLLDSFQKGDEPDTIQLELRALTLGSNAAGRQVRRALALALVQRCAQLLDAGRLSPKDAVAATLPPHGLLVRGCVDVAVPAEQAEFLLFLQTALAARPQGGRVLLFACNVLATADLIEPDGFEAWWKDGRSAASPALLEVRRETKQLVDVLVGDEEGSEEEEDDESEEVESDAPRSASGNHCLPGLPPRPPSFSRETLPRSLCLRTAVVHSPTYDPAGPAVFVASAPLHITTPPVPEPADSVVGRSSPSVVTKTPPVTRKRKLDSAALSTTTTPTTTADDFSQEIALPRRKASKVTVPESVLVEAALPATPLTLNSDRLMDSDDEFNSVASSDVELGEDQDSSVDEFGAGDSDGDMDEYQEDDSAFEAQAKDLKPKRKAFEVDFKVYSPQDIQAQQDQQIQTVADLIEQPLEATAILLRYGRWNKERLIENYMDDQEDVLNKAGLGQDMNRHPPRIESLAGFACEICCEDRAGLPSFAMSCGHRFCVDCYRRYLAQKIREEGEAARIKCPGDGCHNIIDAKSLDLLVTADLTARYHELLMRTYVDDKENLKWCPAPNCVYAVECGVKRRELAKVVPTVRCACKHDFCFGCTLSDHQPAPCALVRRWLKKCEDDSETANWISANTKECPKCRSTIEKNGGCNHMTCRKCRHEFCWMCMGVWAEHGTSWYNCNRFEERSGKDARDAQAESRQSLERYLHYYNRYANHEQSAKLDKDLFHKTERKMTLLQSTSGLSWIEVQFLEAASQALQQCRQTLKWTYAFAFYLARNNATAMFEDNQKDLEMAVENLSEMFERPPDQLAGLKLEMIDKTTYCMRRRVILLDDTAQNLKEKKWEFNVELSG